MKISRFLMILIVLIVCVRLRAQEKKSILATRASSVIKIDGELSDEAWKYAPVAKDFVQFEPINGSKEKFRQKTEVKVLYTDDAIYIGATMYDSSPDSILRQITKRDVYNENCDWFGVFINPYNDGLTDFNFWVTAAGTQSDSRCSALDDDFTLNSVWKSAVKITDFGWAVEVEIPYIALRFPETQIATWGLNFMRSIRRSRRTFSWNFIDKTSGYRQEYQCGLLTGVKEINPPTRVSFIPYLSAYHDEFGGKRTNQINSGLDLKIGLNESFTLDMTVIPDFGQVAYDQQFLNLSPFENRFNENRQFFSEGTELFNIGDLVYTRRIGGAPKNIQGIDLNSSDSVEIRQHYTQLLNATKVSGRTNGNLGVGILNALTNDNYTTRITSGEQTRVLTEPLTNYNVIVLDQRIRRNSSINFINTNVLRRGSARDANVTAIMTSFFDKTGAHLLETDVRQSAVFMSSKPAYGYLAKVRLSDVKGHWRWACENFVSTEKFDINDLGFQQRNNAHYQQIELGYRTIQPVGPFNKVTHDLVARYQHLYKPSVYEEAVISYKGFFLLRSFFAFSLNGTLTPGSTYNYYEPRQWGRRFKTPQQNSIGGFISTDYRKTLALDLRGEYLFWTTLGKNQITIEAKPRLRLGDHFFGIPQFKVVDSRNDYGYVPDNDPNNIFFGRRRNKTLITSLDAQYVFTSKSSLSVLFRHTFTDVDYKDFYLLNTDGTLTSTSLSGINDLNFNAFNIDLKYSWWFAPASEMVILYRNSVASAGNKVGQSIIRNLEGTFDAPIQNNISFKLNYFLDYNASKKYLKYHFKDN